jgi:hypothetical protein
MLDATKAQVGFGTLHDNWNWHWSRWWRTWNRGSSLQVHVGPKLALLT